MIVNLEKPIGSKKKNEEMAQEECFIGNAQTDAITKIDGLVPGT